MSQEKVKVVFIGGYGRSGSTLLDRMLGQVEGFVSVGELRHIWDRSFGENQLCGCGEPFKKCAFWREVVERAFGAFESVDLSRVRALKRSVDRMRYIPQLMFPSLRSHEYQMAFSEYAEILSRLYKGIRDVSGSQFIIDSTKDPSYGFILSAMQDVELHVVHLVRDSRAVAYSWQRKKRRPEIHWKEEYMPRYSPLKSAWEWGLMNGLVQLLGYTIPGRYTLVRYEDVVSQPREALSRLLAGLGITNPNLDFINDRNIKLSVDHTVSGNPIRFQHGVIEVRPDTEWRHKMSTPHRVIVSALTWPLLLKYGYFGK
ncbi:sulfotransferase [Thermus thermophilus]|uniref:sulfotransferase n=2 Tax=Thermus thermophilus TaxID=274 RepID=UPI001161C5CE|nr:sulfotransferase [Thermus thermophilus]BBL81900.1 sulfotransferase family protein [Thermus thermophilus]BBL84203.1 sulfotransferase family protein [Thermus thermophilus]BCZ94075.1 sulfotransferase family protein [Thermus thermophilus]